MSYHEESHIAGPSGASGQHCQACGAVIDLTPRKYPPGQHVGVLRATRSGAHATYPIMNPTGETPEPCRL